MSTTPSQSVLLKYRRSNSLGKRGKKERKRNAVNSDDGYRTKTSASVYAHAFINTTTRSRRRKTVTIWRTNEKEQRQKKKITWERKTSCLCLLRWWKKSLVTVKHYHYVFHRRVCFLLAFNKKKRSLQVYFLKCCIY